MFCPSKPIKTDSNHYDNPAYNSNNSSVDGQKSRDPETTSYASNTTFQYYERSKKYLNETYESLKSRSLSFWKRKSFCSICLFLVLLVTCVVIVVVVLATASNLLFLSF